MRHRAKSYSDGGWTTPVPVGVQVQMRLGKVAQTLHTIEAVPGEDGWAWTSRGCDCDPEACVHVAYARQIAARALGLPLTSLMPGPTP